MHIDVLDVIQAVNYIMGLVEPNEDQFWASDMNDDMTINKDKSHIDSYLAESLTRDYPDLFNGNADKEEIERLQDIISDASNSTHDAEGYLYDLQNSLEEASSILG